MEITRVGDSQIKQAKRVNLIEHLLKHRPDVITRDKNSRERYVHPEHDSLVILDRGFMRFATGDTGDQIQFLVNYCGLTFIEAVKELCDSYVKGIKTVLSLSERRKEGEEGKTYFNPPKPADDFYKRVWSYLVTRRGIPSEVVRELIKDKLLYQEIKYGNCVFLSNSCDYAEIVGVGYTDFKKIEAGSDSNGYWIIDRNNKREETTVYVTESAIDAISLYTLLLRYRPNQHFAVASMGGLKEHTLERIKGEGYKGVVIAVDNDAAGKSFAVKNMLKADTLRIPEITSAEGEKIKDWNDLLKYNVKEADIEYIFA